MNVTRYLAVFLLALTFALVACTGPGSSGAAASVTASAHIILPEPLLEELTALRQRVDVLDRRSAGLQETSAELPRWLLNFFGRERKPLDAQRRGELAVIAGAASVEPRVRALALRELGAGRELEDIPAIARFVDAADDTGRYPQYFPSQGFSQDLSWRPKTLGRDALDALETITGGAFADSAAFAAWQKQNPDPRKSLAYWEGTLRRDASETRRARLGELLAIDPDLFLRVLLAEDGHERSSWWDEADLVRIVREHLGTARTLQLLRFEGHWPELTEPPRFRSFAGWIIDHADSLFEPGDAASLFSLWEHHGRLWSSDVASRFALVMMRWNPAERARIAEMALHHLAYDRGPVLAELARRDLGSQFPLIKTWFRRSDLEPEQIADIQRGILQGFAAAPKPAARRLKDLAGAPGFETDSPEVVGALVAAARAAGATMPFPELENIHRWLPTKGGRAPTADDEARPARARKDCVMRVQRWLATIK